ncbi:hypothetical protein [Streptomyces sp. NPDC002463]|uniref:hypothetical protein n=1 Tax=Streptomyces sp. NPDC002463 TaxID=3364645 RepID=UPI0036B1F6A0
MEDLKDEAYICRLADGVGMRKYDLFLVAGLTVPDSALAFDKASQRELPQLVRLALSLSTSSRRQLRDFVQSVNDLPMDSHSRDVPAFESYPPGFGSLLVRMLGLRNLGWSSAAKVMYLMSGVHLSAATIGAVGRGAKELDAEILSGFSAVLGIPIETLSVMTGVQRAVERCKTSERNADVAALLWDIRHFAAGQVQEAVRRANELKEGV